MPGIIDGKLFKFKEEKDGQIKANCLLCPPGKPPLSGSYKATSNFVKHLKRCHPAKLSEYESRKKLKKSESDTGQKQTSMLEFTGKSKKPCTQAQAQKTISSCVIKCGLPISIVEHPAFQSMVQDLSGGACKSITRKTFQSRLDDQFESASLEIKQELSKADYVCTTADIWSNRKRSFLGITAHVIDGGTLARKSWAISCERFPGTHSFDAIAERLQNNHEKYALDVTKLTKTVTDNATNFAKAFREFGLKEALTEDGEEVSIEEEEDDDDIVFEVINDLEQSNDTEGYLLPPQERCFSHTLSLIATTDIKKAGYSGPHKKIFHSSFAKTSAIWNKCNLPKSAEIIQEVCQRSLVTPCVTRWNSMFDSLVCLLEFDVDKLKDLCKKLGVPEFKDIEVEFLQEYCKVLTPIAMAIDKFQGEKNCFYGFVIPVLKQVENQLKKLEDSSLKYNQPLVAASLSGLFKRFRPFLDQDSTVKDAKLATVSHPLFKLKPIARDEREGLKSVLIQEAEKLNKNQGETELETEKSDAYFQWSDDEDQGSTTGNTNQTSIEVLQYLDDPNTSLEILHRYPSVKNVFIKYNTTIPSSAPVERLFSFGSIILHGRRGRLTDKNFEKLVLMRANNM